MTELLGYPTPLSIAVSTQTIKPSKPCNHLFLLAKHRHSRKPRCLIREAWRSDHLSDLPRNIKVLAWCQKKRESRGEENHHSPFPENLAIASPAGECLKISIRKGWSRDEIATKTPWWLRFGKTKRRNNNYSWGWGYFTAFWGFPNTKLPEIEVLTSYDMASKSHPEVWFSEI